MAGLSCGRMKTLLISVPGMSRELLGQVPAGTRLGALVGGSSHGVSAMVPTWPAVTCSVQATLTTGLPPAVHGIIANGLPMYRLPVEAGLVDGSNHGEYRRQVSFWEQSNQLLAAPRFWEGKTLKTAMLCFQHSMPGFAGRLSPAAEVVLTPKPEHGPDGRITSLVWTSPSVLGGELQKALGPFPLMHYWGPAAGIASSRWIAAAGAMVLQQHQPDLLLVYLPHLDYDLQRYGPASEKAAAAVAELSGAAEGLLEAAEAGGYAVVVVSEYAISAVDGALMPNVALREAGLLKLTRNAEGPQIDYLGSEAWAMCDHQVAHVYARTPAGRDAAEAVLRRLGLEPAGVRVAHPRAGQLQVQSPPGKWLDYRWWRAEEGAEAAVVPDWATTIDIHRKPGYDPLELFAGSVPRRVATDAGLVRGSHGRVDTSGVLIWPKSAGAGERVEATAVAGILEGLLAR